MKMFKKYACLMAIAAAVGFTACSESNDYQVGAVEKGDRVYFSTEAPSTYTVTQTTSSIEVPILRNTTEGEWEAAIALEADAEYASLFNVTPYVTFEEGAKSANVAVTFDRSKLTDGKTYTVTLNVSDATLHSNYALSSYTMTLVVPEPYVLLGTGLIRDDLVSGLFGLEVVEWEVEVYENTNRPGYVFLKNAYTSTYPYNEPGDYRTEDVYFEINIANPDQVIIPQQLMGLDWNPTQYGEIFVGTLQPGTLKNGIITFPVKGLALGMMIYNEGQLGFYANANGLFRVCLPGAVMTDYSMEVAYDGMDVAADNKTVAAKIVGKYGADVASFKYTYFNDDVTAYAAQIAAGIADGTYEANDYEIPAEGDGTFTIYETELEAPAKYTVAVVPVNAEGEVIVDEVAVAAFNFPGLGGAGEPAVEPCLIEAYLDYMKNILPSYASSYPSNTSLAAVVDGEDIVAGGYALLKGDMQAYEPISGPEVEEIVAYILEANGITEADLFSAFTAQAMGNMNDPEAAAVMAFNKLTPSTYYTLFVKGENSTGGVTYVAHSFATTATANAAAPVAAAGTFVRKPQLEVVKHVAVEVLAR